MAARLPKLLVDPILIEQVLVNLLKNAAESIEQAQRPTSRSAASNCACAQASRGGQPVIEFSVHRHRPGASRPR